MEALVLNQSKISKTLFITGGSKGLGLTILKKYLENGYDAICVSRTKPKLTKFKNKVKFIKCDLSNTSAENIIHNFLTSQNIKIDTLINNVGKSNWKSLQQINYKFINEMFQLNLFSTIMVTKITQKYFKKNSSIINISSLASKRGTINNSIYCSAKFALNGFTQSLSKELGKKGIRVNAICPVLVKTPGLTEALKSKESPSNGKNINKFLLDFKKKQTALNKLPSAIDVSNLCIFLSSPFSNSITGQCINIDCGILSN